MASLYLQRKELVYYMGVQNTCHMIREPKPLYGFSIDFLLKFVIVPEGGDTLGISGWGCAAGSLEPLTFTRASSPEFCYPILE